MARKVEVTMVSDLSGSVGEVETVEFGVDGVGYEIDLTVEEADKLREAMEPYASVARKVGKSGKPIKSTRVGPDPKTVRAWAESVGKTVPSRGRIPAALIEEFEAANG